MSHLVDNQGVLKEKYKAVKGRYKGLKGRVLEGLKGRVQEGGMVPGGLRGRYKGLKGRVPLGYLHLFPSPNHTNPPIMFRIRV